VRDELDRATVRVGQPQPVVALLVADLELRQAGLCIVERARAVELERDVVVADRLARDELERVGLVVAREERAPVDPSPLDQPELDAPARRRLVQVAHAQADVVDAAETDQVRPSATSRSASASGIASAT
jgi:hypothetical protein